MRILIAGANRSAIGGAEMYQRSLIPALFAEGHVVALLHERVAVAGKDTVDPQDAEVTSWCTAQIGIEMALDEIATWNPDVVFIQGLASSALEALLLDRFRCVLFAHSYYGTCETGTKCYSFPNLRHCMRRFGPMCIALHFPRRCGGLRPSAMLNSYRLQLRRNQMLNRYRAICVASHHMYREYRRHEVPAECLHVMLLPPAGIRADTNRPAVPPPNGSLLFTGRLTHLKGAGYLLLALPIASRQLGRDLSVKLLGDGPEYDRLVRMTEQLGVAAEFTAWLGGPQRNALFRSVELLVVPSLWPEPWGLVGMEAACVGLPAVAFAAGGIPEWLDAGKTGELAPTDPPTAQGLADAITRALSDRGHYEQLSHGAWNRARHFTIEAHLQELLPVLRRASTI